MVNVKNVRNSLVLGALLLVLATPLAYAGDDDDKEKGGKAPEVPIALMLPAAAVAAVSVRAFVHRKR